MGPGEALELELTAGVEDMGPALESARPFENLAALPPDLADAMESFKLPTNRVVELGSKVEI